MRYASELSGAFLLLVIIKIDTDPKIVYTIINIMPCFLARICATPIVAFFFIIYFLVIPSSQEIV